MLVGLVMAGVWFYQQREPDKTPAAVEEEETAEVIEVGDVKVVAVPEEVDPVEENPVPPAVVESPASERDNRTPPPAEVRVGTIASHQPAVVSVAVLPPEAEVWTYPALLQQNASNNLFRARSKLAAATSEYDRYLALAEAAKLEFVFGNSGQALTNATELLVLDARFRIEPWRGGQAVHDGNFVLGRIAAQQGYVEEARQYLLEAGKSTGSPVLGSFGPNMSLARDLLVRGEREAVLTYFDLCRKFWGSGEKQLTEWSEEVKAGRMPDFGANMYY